MNPPCAVSVDLAPYNVSHTDDGSELETFGCCVLG